MKRDAKATHTYNGSLYGPNQGAGKSVADLDKLHPLKGDDQEDAPEMNETPLETGSVSKEGRAIPHASSATPESVFGTSTGNSEEELSAMSKADLVALAEEKGVTVSRGDGESGAPTKDDYVAQLAGK